jgi:hypothetical protein
MLRTIYFTLALTVAVAVLFVSSVSAKGDIGFHFYGALDCPPCMAFKRNHLEDVRKQGQQMGFAVHENIIPKTSDVPKMGSYGPTDDLLRKAGKQLDYVYPPIFFVTEDGKIVSVFAGDWKGALEIAVTFSKQG